LHLFSTLTKFNMQGRRDHEPWSLVYEEAPDMWGTTEWTLYIEDYAFSSTVLGGVVDHYNRAAADRPWLVLDEAEFTPIYHALAPFTTHFSRVCLMPLEDPAYGMLLMGGATGSGRVKTLLYLDQETCTSWERIASAVAEGLRHAQQR
jgi:hypothetical protein